MKAIPYKLILTLVILAGFALWVVPPTLRAVAAFIDMTNPARYVAGKLQADIDRINKLNADLLVEHDSLNAVLNRARTLTSTTQSRLDSALSVAVAYAGDAARLRQEVDRLEGRLSAVSSGGGTTSLSDSGLVINGRYSDDWVDVYVGGHVVGDEYVYDSLSYDFQFGVGDVRVTTTDEFNNHRTVYSVWIESLKNPANRRYLSDYAVSETYYKPKARVMDWWDMRAGVYYIVNTSQAEAALSFMSVGFGPPEDGNVLRFPVVGLLSDFADDHRVGASMSLNIGYFLPLIQNLHIAIGYAWGQTAGVVIGVGAML